MKIPQLSGPLYLLMQPSFKYALTDANNKCSSVINRATELPVLQLTAASQPTLAQTAAGQWRSTNFPKSTTISALVFSGAQYMSHDVLATRFSGAEPPLTVLSVASCTSPATGTQTIWSFVGAGTSLVLQYNSSNIVLKEVNGSGTFTVTVATDTKLHVFTAVRSATTLTLRIDGVQAGTTALTANTETFTTFSVGGTNTAGTVSNFLTGAIATTVVAGLAVNSGIYPVEIDQLVATGIIRSATSGTNVGF